MNRFDRNLGKQKEAKLSYEAGKYEIISPGDFVRCAVTGKPVRLKNLKYWSVDLQEAYASASISLRRFQELKQKQNDKRD